MDTWDKLTQDEKDWIKEHGYGEKDVNENPVECTINMLWPEYACRGYILHDMERYVKRYKNSPAGSWPNLQVERMQRALPIMKQLKWD